MIEKLENISIGNEIVRTPNISEIVIKVNEIIEHINKLEEILK